MSSESSQAPLRLRSSNNYDECGAVTDHKIKESSRIRSSTPGKMIPHKPNKDVLCVWLNEPNKTSHDIVFV